MSKIKKVISELFTDFSQQYYNENQKTLNGWYKTKTDIFFEDHQQNKFFVSKTNPSFVFLKNGIIHNEDGPAVVQFSTEDKCMSKVFYFYEGRLHRKEGPAFIEYNKAVIFKDYKVSLKEGTLIKYSMNYKNGILHNLSGAAVQDYEFPKENKFFVDGLEYSEHVFNKIEAVRNHQGIISLKKKMKNSFTD